MPSRGRPSDAEYAEFVHATWAGLYRTAYLLVADHGLAEDLVQTALAKTYASWSRIDDRGSAPAYARTTLVNTAMGWFRKRSWRNEVPTEALPEGVSEGDPTLRPTVVGALARLAPRQRAVVVLRYYEDATVAETARALGCSEGTVKSQTSDALSRLRTLLGDSVIPHKALGGSHD